MPAPSDRIVRFAWMALLGALICLSAPNWGVRFRGPAPRFNDPDASDEAMLALVTGRRDLPNKLDELLTALPAERPILVLRAPGQMAAGLPSEILARRAWPRRVIAQDKQALNTPEAVALIRSHFSAVVFLAQPAPEAFGAGENLGGGMTFVRLAAQGQ